VDIGDRVQAGQVLAELSVPELQEQLRQKEALAAQARAEVENSKRMVATAEATVTRSGAALKVTEAGLTRAEADFTYWQNENEGARRLLPSAPIDQSTAEQTFQHFRAAGPRRGGRVGGPHRLGRNRGLIPIRADRQPDGAYGYRAGRPSGRPCDILAVKTGDVVGLPGVA
jgi:multidrug efflux pump subunit AcrA (membrane-fusion protein)